MTDGRCGVGRGERLARGAGSCPAAIARGGPVEAGRDVGRHPDLGAHPAERLRPAGAVDVPVELVDRGIVGLEGHVVLRVRDHVGLLAVHEVVGAHGDEQELARLVGLDLVPAGRARGIRHRTARGCRSDAPGSRAGSPAGCRGSGRCRGTPPRASRSSSSTERFASSRASSYTASNDAKVKSSTPAGTAETGAGAAPSRTRGECRGRGGRTQGERGDGERGDEGPR